ncbi:MAG: SGNH/GDSL hydrolase family protein [Myxococcales bacterium]|nr:SGNH/GDSL hydrolase family protein [Myxococcales bacterium]MDD9970312.1 SGNH/GDSL hydrolase family protein [Myxococcales bacterium]
MRCGRVRIWGLLALATTAGCAAQTSEEAIDVGAIEASLQADDGAIHPGCHAFRKQCFAGNEKMCAKYSTRCEVRVGVIGDSLSDEYQGFVNLPGLQWTAQVQDDPRITLGAPQNDPSTRGEPRNDGFGLNWARYGQAALATQWNSPEVVAALGGYQDPRWVDIGSFDDQIYGLAGQIATGDVDVAVIWVGHNDLFLRDVLTLPVDAAFVGALVSRIVTAAVILQNAGDAKVAIMGLAGSPASIAPLNAALAGGAASAGVTFIDPFHTVITHLTSGPTITVGGMVLAPFAVATANFSDLSPTGTGPCAGSPFGTLCATEAYAESYRHYDGIHPNTLYMGLIGNEIVADLNGAFGFSMRPVPESQLLHNAGL